MSQHRLSVKAKLRHRLTAADISVSTASMALLTVTANDSIDIKWALGQTDLSRADCRYERSSCHPMLDRPAKELLHGHAVASD